MKLPAFFEEDRRLVDAELERLLPAENERPAVIHQAMRYSVFAGGKRVRPILCIEAFRIFSNETASALPVACALEFIHTYSLIHDDLPALDNDDLRRGRPTCHKQFGEAMAILAGDGLLTLAFETLANAPAPPAQRVALIQEIASAAGTRDGMVGGQVADLEAERKQVTPEMLEYIHRSKTAALIRASIVAGAIAGGASQEDRDRLSAFGGLIGWAFQVTDDILDVGGVFRGARQDGGKRSGSAEGDLSGALRPREVPRIRAGAGHARHESAGDVRRARGESTRTR